MTELDNSYSAEELGRLLKEMEQMQDELETMHQENSKLRQENQKLQQERQLVAPMLDRIQQLLSDNSTLKSELRKMSAKIVRMNSADTILSENAELQKKLQSAQQSVKQLKVEVQWKTTELKSLEKQIEEMGDNFDKLMDAMPRTGEIRSFTDAIRDAKRAMFLHGNIGLVILVIMLLFGAFLSVATYRIHGDTQQAAHEIQAIQQGIYTTKGWAVLDGAAMNESTYAKEHPEEYQQYLERQQQKK